MFQVYKLHYKLIGGLRMTDYRPATELKPKVKDFLDQVEGFFIDGEYVKSDSGKTFDVVNPATEEVIATLSEAQEEDVDRAVEAARKAFDEGPWTQMEAAERERMIYKFADLLEAHREELAQLEALDNGKTYHVALEDDVDGTVQHFRYYAGWATKIFGKTTNVSPDYVTYTLHEPVGVVGQIIPWNFPLAMAGWKMGAALAAGCTIVIKPASETPLSLLYIGELINEAGFPERGREHHRRFRQRGGSSAQCTPESRQAGIHRLDEDGQHDHAECSGQCHWCDA